MYEPARKDNWLLVRTDLPRAGELNSSAAHSATDHRSFTCSQTLFMLCLPTLHCSEEAEEGTK